MVRVAYSGKDIPHMRNRFARLPHKARAVFRRPAFRAVSVFSLILFLLAPVFLPLLVSAAPVPSLVVSLPAETLIGEDVSFSISFQNTGTNEGYGPFIDLIFPFTGADGIYPFSPGLEEDGLDFVSASFLSTPLTTSVFQFTDTEPCVDHPYAVDTSGQPISICGTPGDKLVVLQLPFGSFVPGQPDVDVSVNATLHNWADAGTDLTVQARGGFQFGATPANDFTTDPSVLNTFSDYDTTPTVFSIRKNYVGPEDETASGQNFPREFNLFVDIADSLTLTDFVMNDNLDNRVVYDGFGSSSPSATITDTPGTPGAQNPPANNLTLEWASLTGTTSGTDASASFDFYVDRLDANAASVINPTAGGCVNIPNDISATADWDPDDPRDSITPVSSDVTPTDETFEACSMVIQKSVAMASDTGPAGYTPGDIVQYTLNFQVSDYFALSDVIINDLMSDGQRFDTGFTPTLSFTSHGVSTSGAMDPSSFTVTDHFTGGAPAVPPIEGTQEVSFDISGELSTRSYISGSDLIGGCVPFGGGAIDCTGSSATTGTLVFRAEIQELFTDEYAPQNDNVDQGDILTNSVEISGQILVNSTLAGTGNYVSEGSGATFSILNGALAVKDIYAINGITGSYSTPAIGPGDTVTYRIRFEMPTSDVEDLVITDYLPLPVFEATEITTFDPTVNATVPPAGTVKFGANDTFFALTGITPILTNDGTSNTFTLDYGSNQEVTEVSSVIELYVTVTASDEPFADGLFLTNQAQSTQGTTNSTTETATQIVQVELTLPNLQITKGIIATDGPAGVFDPAPPAPESVTAPDTAGFRFGGTVSSSDLDANPMDSNLSDVDSDDLVSFVIVVENTGQGVNGAFDVGISDTLPADFVIPVAGNGLNLRVTDGAGNPLSWTAADGTDTVPLFEDGIILDDGVTGALDAYDTSSGGNIALITYDLQIVNDVEPESLIENTATLFQYASTEGGPDFVSINQTDAAEVSGTKAPDISKSYTTTNHAGSTDPDVVVGEQITYEVVLDIPEGEMTGTDLTDTLDSGLALLGIDSIVASSGDVTTSHAGGFAGVAADIVVTNSGRTIEFPFDTITNVNTDDGVTETITVTYTVVVLNNNQIYRDRARNNSAVFTYQNGTVSDSASNVNVAEPTLQITKTPSPTSADAGDTVTFTLVISHTGASDANAYDVQLEDIIPTGMTYVAASVSHDAGLAPDNGPSESGGTISATWNTFPDDGSTSTISFDVTIDSTVPLGGTVTNTAGIEWTSLPGDITADQSTYASPSTERTGDTGNPGGSENDYTTSANGPVSILSVNPVKTIAATSEASTTALSGIERVTVGEIVRYRMVIRVAESTATNLQLRDNLSTGMQFIDDGTAMVAFVSNDAGITSSTLIPGSIGCDGGSNPDIAFTGNQTTVSGITPECPLPDSAVSNSAGSDVDTYASGTDIYFKLGNVVNDDRDGDDELIVVEFNALVRNEASNVSATNRDNTFNVFENGSSVAVSTTGNSSRVRIAEPVVSVAKAVTVAPTDAGDALQYTITVTNTDTSVNGASAFDFTVTDTVPAEAAVQSVSVSTPNGYTDNSSGQNVSVVLDTLGKGQAATITINTFVSSVVQPEEIISNSASAVWTSLPGTNGTTGNPTGSANSGSAGTATGERTGQDGVGLLNDYTASSTANTSVGSVIIDKLSPSPTSYPIGSSVDYDIRVTLPEGTVSNVVVTDFVPAGMDYTGYQVITTSGTNLPQTFAGSVPAPSVSGGTGSGSDVSFTFSSISTTADNDTGNNSFLVRVTLVILNELTTQRGDTLGNTAGLVFDNPNGPGTLAENDLVPENITVLEPILQLTKTASSVPAEVEAGTTVEYEIEVQHHANSNSTAHDVVINDPAQSNLTITGVSVNVTGSISTPSSTFTGNTVRVPASGSFDLPDDGTIVTVTVTATVSAGASETITNIADTTWASTDLPNTNARTDGSGEYDLAESGATGLNDYETSDDDMLVTTSDPTAVKSIAQTSLATTSDASDPVELTPGEEVTFFILIGIGEGTTTSLQVLDDLAPNIEYVSHAVVTNAAASYGNMAQNFSGTIPAPSCTGCTPGSDGADLTFDFSNIVNTVDGNGLNDFFGLQIVARLTDNPINDGLPSGTTDFSNSATVQANVPTGPVIDAGTVDMTVVEPDVTITKEFDTGTDPDQASPYDIATVTIVIGNDGSTDAYDITWEDDLESIQAGVFNYQNDLGVVCTGGVPVTMTVDDTADPLLTGQLGRLPAGESCTVTFSVELDGTIDQGTYPTVTNETAVTSFDNHPSSPAEQRSQGPVTASDTITVAVVDLEIVKDDSDTEVDPGDTAIYTLSVTNNGLADATGITVTETVPANTQFDASNSTVGWTCTPDSAPGAACTFDLSTHLGSALAGNGGTTDIYFALTVDNPVAPGTVSIANTASVEDDGASGVDPTPGDNTDTDTNAMGNVVDLIIVKTAADTETTFNTDLVFTLEYENVGTVDAENVEITETVPTDSEFNPTLSAPGWSCTPDNLAGSTCTLALGTVAENTSGSVEFAVTTGDYALGVYSEIENTASIADDGTYGPDSNPSDNTSTATVPVLYTNVFDPPSAQKTFNDDELPEMEWVMVWINDGNTVALNVRIVDPVPAGTTYIPGSFVCEPRGVSATTLCEYDSLNNQVVWEGSIGPDTGGTTEDDSDNEVVLTFKTSVPAEIEMLENQAMVYWDDNMDGNVDDDILAGQTAGMSNDPDTTEAGDPTIWERPELAATGAVLTVPALLATLIIAAVIAVNIQQQRGITLHGFIHLRKHSGVADRIRFRR
ncbi:MAG: hypothetical protein TR69_WS6001001372 [candidate division WS6 bacterium OLB20]|uniref:DUF11 domain-containing protein n=1 Tax=candidate division WS6 bacterium OLB20 TaxID=1617426 RepID=A0A136LWQ3_9BACT|nr:MAG: hypothetical protein TR69_WS6001001372 [candidate division WS6 bacterium OLB20]